MAVFCSFGTDKHIGGEKPCQDNSSRVTNSFHGHSWQTSSFCWIWKSKCGSLLGCVRSVGKSNARPIALSTTYDALSPTGLVLGGVFFALLINKGLSINIFFKIC